MIRTERGDFSTRVCVFSSFLFGFFIFGFTQLYLKEGKDINDLLLSSSDMFVASVLLFLR